MPTPGILTALFGIRVSVRVLSAMCGLPEFCSFSGVGAMFRFSRVWDEFLCFSLFLLVLLLLVGLGPVQGFSQLFFTTFFGSAIRAGIMGEVEVF